MATLIDVAYLIMGQSPPSSTYNEAGDGLAFFQGKTDFGFRHPTPRLYCSMPLRIAKPDDILMSVRAPVGPTNIADREYCIGRGLAAIRPRNIDGDFLFFNLRYIEKSIASLGSGSTFHAINKSQLASLEVNSRGFSLPEQRKIAAVLSLVQRAMGQQERLLALTAELKKRTDAARIRPFFLNHYFNWDETQVRLKSIATRAVSQSNISATRLRGFPVPVPSPEEQNKIVTRIDCVDRKLSVHQRKHAALTALFRTLLHQLMTAQIRVHDLDLPELETTFQG